MFQTKQKKTLKKFEKGSVLFQRKTKKKKKKKKPPLLKVCDGCGHCGS